MDMKGERLIPAPRTVVWQALNDPAILQAAIPGCTSLVKDSDTQLSATATVKIGPISAKFAGKVQLLDLDPPQSYRITGEGHGGIAGFAKVGATIRLSEHENGTLLAYTADVQIGGKIAQLGARLIDSTAKQMTGVFFDRFAAAIAPPITSTPSPSKAEAAPGLPPTPPSPSTLGVQWHGASLLLGVLTGAAITIIAMVIGHSL